jgi:hypothetical protein
VSPDRCIADRCDKWAQPERKYCRGHRRREELRKSLEEPLRDWGTDPDAYLEQKAIELGLAKDDSERAYQLARKRLKFAAREYVRKTSRQKVAKTTKTPR